MSSKNEAKQEFSKLPADETDEIMLQLPKIYEDPQRVSELSQRLLKLGKLEDKESQQQIDRILKKLNSLPWPINSAGTPFEFELIHSMLHVLSSENPLESQNAISNFQSGIMFLIKKIAGNENAEERLLLRSCLKNYLQLVVDNYKVDVKRLGLSSAMQWIHVSILEDTALIKRDWDEWLEILEFLIKHCTDLNTPDASEDPFKIAAQDASPQVVQLFLENRARPTQPINPLFKNYLLIADYQEKLRTPAMGRLEALIQEAKTAKEAKATFDALSQDNLVIPPLIKMIVGYLDEAQPDSVPIHYPTWVEEQLKKLTALIPAKEENPSGDIKTIKDEVINVLGSPFLKEQCEIYWKDLQIARQKGTSLDDVLPPRKKITNAPTAAPTIQGKQDDKGSPVDNRSAFSFSSTHTTTDRSKGSDTPSDIPATYQGSDTPSDTSAQVQESSGRKKSF